MTSMSVLDSRPAGLHRGRPRDTRIDARILDAAQVELAECGFIAFSVEGVAARAEVSKAAVYRRFPSRDALLMTVLHAVAVDVVDIPAGLPIREHLIALLSEIRDRSPKSPGYRIMRHAAALATTDSSLSHVVMTTLVTPRRERIRAALRTGIEKGELKPDLDVDTVMAMLVGAVVHLGIWSAEPDLARVRVDDVVDLALSGIAESAG